MRVQIISPFTQGHPLWLGLESEGHRRKVFKVCDAAINGSEFLTAGLTVFEPGEASSLHNHPDSEEVNFIVRGSGDVISDNERSPFDEGSFMFTPKGVFHQHINTGTEPLWMIFIYGPHGEPPRT